MAWKACAISGCGQLVGFDFDHCASAGIRRSRHGPKREEAPQARFAQLCFCPFPRVGIQEPPSAHSQDVVACLIVSMGSITPLSSQRAASRVLHLSRWICGFDDVLQLPASEIVAYLFGRGDRKVFRMMQAMCLSTHFLSLAAQRIP